MEVSLGEAFRSCVSGLNFGSLSMGLNCVLTGCCPDRRAFMSVSRSVVAAGRENDVKQDSLEQQ